MRRTIFGWATALVLATAGCGLGVPRPDTSAIEREIDQIPGISMVNVHPGGPEEGGPYTVSLGFVSDTHDQQRMRALADRALRVLWNRYPLKLNGVRVDVAPPKAIECVQRNDCRQACASNPEECRSFEDALDAEELRRRFGPRPDDLPEG